MLTIPTRCLELAGDNYGIGRQLGTLVVRHEPMRSFMLSQAFRLDDASYREAGALFDRFCPGLNAEIEGCADALGVAPQQVAFCAMTYLQPRCSHMALLPAITANAHTMLARSYEFSHEAEDFILARTSVAGKYVHLGTSILAFGRDDGVNEHGFAVTMSSCGLPVGAPPEMRNPVLKGFQFWAIIRALLENCRDTEEGLAYLNELPLAYNINLIMADASGRAVLYETLDGRTAYRKSGEAATPYLVATNHPHLPELAMYESQAMNNSVVRYRFMTDTLASGRAHDGDSLKRMLLGRYPSGLCSRYYHEYFGTTKSIVMDANARTLEICWGGRLENGWRKHDVATPLTNSVREISIDCEQAPAGMFDMVAIRDGQA